MGVQDKKVHNDNLLWVKFSDINWTNDSKGFFNCRFPAPKEGEEVDVGTETNVKLDHQVYYHFPAQISLKISYAGKILPIQNILLEPN
ncbi:hypothetical protein ACET3Z_021038 [Daucus carota]